MWQPQSARLLTLAIAARRCSQYSAIGSDRLPSRSSAIYLLSPQLSGVVTVQNFIVDGEMSRKMQYV
ncbi:hypothetical protein BER93_16050 [Xanthomonas fragariae]|nr:hypothetical protein BER92_16005 [Xanthomonas fragariae]AOD19354.1 hypothetical protein BER93_16050 [Xanthomonas fragariae]ENZ93800.1 short-chain dehydrogenase [Xanthomonas fragariae LMG 25863]